MTDERSSHIENSNDVDKHTAATLAAALIAHGFTLPAATNAAMAAEQAVDLYRTVLGTCESGNGRGARVDGHAS